MSSSRSIAHLLQQIPHDRRPALQQWLAGFILPERLERMEQILTQRTRYMTVVLEDLYQAHNLSAVLRSCECFGVQDVHVIQHRHHFRPSKTIVQGADRWLTIHRHRDRSGGDPTTACLEGLKRQGYRIAAATLQPGSIPLEQVPLDRPLALCFGTEHEGLGARAHALADLHVHIPMQGFTQSLNVSVSAALAIHDLSRRLRAEGCPWPLDEEEIETLRLDWMVGSLKAGDELVQQFIAEDQG